MGKKCSGCFFLYKPRQNMVIIFSSSYKYRLWGYRTNNDNKTHSFDRLFFTFPPSFTQFTSSWPHRQFFLFFLWSLCAVLSLLDWKTPKQLNDQRSHNLPHLRQILVNYNNISTCMLNLNSSRTKIKFQSHTLKGKSI